MTPRYMRPKIVDSVSVNNRLALNLRITTDTELVEVWELPDFWHRPPIGPALLPHSHTGTRMRLKRNTPEEIRKRYERYLAAYSMRLMWNYSDLEIAGKLNVNPNTVHTWLLGTHRVVEPPRYPGLPPRVGMLLDPPARFVRIVRHPTLVGSVEPSAGPSTEPLAAVGDHPGPATGPQTPQDAAGGTGRAVPVAQDTPGRLWGLTAALRASAAAAALPAAVEPADVDTEPPEPAWPPPGARVRRFREITRETFGECLALAVAAVRRHATELAAGAEPASGDERVIEGSTVES